MATRFYGLIWKWHFAMGLIACPLVAIVALTGAIYAFEPELKRWADADALVVEPQGPLRSLDELAALVTNAKCAPAQIYIVGPADASHVFYCEDERATYVDPYRGAVLGEPSSWVKWLIDLAFGLHWELLLGSFGRLLVEWASSMTILLLFSGAILWWPRGKRRGGGVLWPRTSLKGRQWLRDLHAIAGAYVLPVLLALAATGLMWTIHAGDARWNKIAQEAEHEHPKSRVIPGAPRITIDRALAGAGIERAQTQRTVWIGIPGPKAAADQPYGLFVHDTTQESPSMIASISVDAYSGVEIDREGWDQRTAIQKVDVARYAIHVGAILGLPGRIAACAASVILAALCITGPWLWWKRRPRGKLGVPPAARAPWPLYLVAVALGWLLPTVGYTLLAIVVIEGVRWLARRHREAPTAV